MPKGIHSLRTELDDTESLNSYLGEEDTRSEFSFHEANRIETNSDSGLDFEP